MAKKDALSKKLSALSASYKSIDEPQFIRTGSITLDALLGGGLPVGTMTVWSSEAGIGKSTGALVVSRTFCEQGKKVLYLDPEVGINRELLGYTNPDGSVAKKGVGLYPYLYDPVKNPDGTFYHFQVQTFREIEEVVDTLIEDVDLIVVDSITSVLVSAKLEISSEDVRPGLDSIVVGNFLKRYKTDSFRNSTSWLLINQMRTQIRFQGASTSEEAGGKALKFYPDIRIMMKEARGGKLKGREITGSGVIEVPYGSVNEIWCIKSRYSRPFVPLKFTVIYGEGVSNLHAYKDFLEHHSAISKSGAWYTINMGEGKGAKVQGTMGIIEWIKENKDDVIAFIELKGGIKLIEGKAQDDDAEFDSLSDINWTDADGVEDGELEE